jgi:hypothetical protein
MTVNTYTLKQLLSDRGVTILLRRHTGKYTRKTEDKGEEEEDRQVDHENFRQVGDGGGGPRRRKRKGRRRTREGWRKRRMKRMGWRRKRKGWRRKRKRRRRTREGRRRRRMKSMGSDIAYV